MREIPPGAPMQVARLRSPTLCCEELTINYRSHPQLIAFASDAFYHRRLRSDGSGSTAASTPMSDAVARMLYSKFPAVFSKQNIKYTSHLNQHAEDKTDLDFGFLMLVIFSNIDVLQYECPKMTNTLRGWR